MAIHAAHSNEGCTSKRRGARSPEAAKPPKHAHEPHGVPQIKGGRLEHMDLAKKKGINAHPQRGATIFYDNYQDNRPGAKATAGNAKSALFAVGVDAVFTHFHNDPNGDPFLLKKGGVAWDPFVDVALLEKKWDVWGGPLGDLLATMSPCGLSYDIDAARSHLAEASGGDAVVRKRAKKGEGIVQAQRAADPILPKILETANTYYAQNPEAPHKSGKVGLKSTVWEPWGFTPFLAEGFLDNAKMMLYANEVLVTSGVDSDLQWSCQIRDEYFMPRLMRTVDAAKVTLEPEGKRRIWNRIALFAGKPNSLILNEIRRLKFLGGDHQTYPRIIAVIAMDRHIGTRVFSWAHPIPELWHAVGAILKKLIIGSGYDDISSPVSWAKRLIFEPIIRFHRCTKPEDATDWGKISVRWHFEDYYRTAQIAVHAWISVRDEILKELGEKYDEKDRPDDVKLLLGLLDDDLLVVGYTLPAIRIADPDTSIAFLWRLQRVAMRWNAKGYASDLAQFLHDVERMDEKQRLEVIWNLSDMIGVKIELLHGLLVRTKTHHQQASVEMINQRHAYLKEIERGCSLLDIILGKAAPDGSPAKSTYSLPTIHDCEKVITFAAEHFKTLFAQATQLPSRSSVCPRVEGSAITESTMQTTAFTVIGDTTLTYTARCLPLSSDMFNAMMNKVSRSIQDRNGLKGVISSSWLKPRQPLAEGAEAKTIKQMSVVEIRESLGEYEKGLDSLQNWVKCDDCGVLRELAEANPDLDKYDNMKRWVCPMRDSETVCKAKEDGKKLLKMRLRAHAIPEYLTKLKVDNCGDSPQEKNVALTCNYLRRAAQGEILFDGIGIFARGGFKRDTADADDWGRESCDNSDIDQAEEREEAEVEEYEEARVPDGWHFVEDAPVVGEIVMLPDGKLIVMEDESLRPLLGNHDDLTYIMMHFEALPKDENTSGWLTATLNTQKKKWGGLCASDKYLRLGCNHRILWKTALTGGELNGTEYVHLDAKNYSRIPRRSSEESSGRTWIIIRKNEQ